MKIRNSFVSNSSSSSYIVIEPGKLTPPDLPNTYIVDQYTGETEFGWMFNEYSGFGSKLIFAYFQTQYVDNAEWMEMIKKALKTHCNVEEIIWKVTIDYSHAKREKDVVDGYIDHQSASHEGSNIEMFNSQEDLEQFLFCKDSYIKTGNDNW